MHFRLKQTIAHVTVLTALLPVAAFAAETGKILRDPDVAPKRGQYAYDTLNGRVVRTTVIGDCVYTLYWTPEGATPECNPNLFGKFSAPAPQAAQAPAQQPVETVTEPVEYETMEYAEAPDYEPAPYEAPPAAAPAPAEEVVPIPPPAEESAEVPTFVDEEVVVAEEEYTGGRVYEDEEGVAADEDIVARREYYEEEEGVQQDEGIVGQSQYYEEEEVVQEDESVVARSETVEEEESVQQDDGIVGQSQYYEEEEVVQEDDGIVARSEYYEEEESVQRDEGIVGQSQYHEEEVVQEDESIVARSEYYEEEGKEPEDLISEPTAPAEESVVAAAEEEQEAAPAVAAAEQEQEAAPAVAAAEQEQEAAPAVAAAEQVQEAAPVVAEQAPAVAEPTPIMLPITITLEAEPWFDFDRYTIRSDARDKLDKLVADLSGIEFDEILVVGHADPIGTPEYNQVLSERRARAVKNYLVGKGLPGVRIKDQGRGEYELPVELADCKDLKKGKLIACLQPDRRVEVTVTGTKPQQ